MEFIRLHARRGFYQNHTCMTFSQGEGLITNPFYSLLLVVREGVKSVAKATWLRELSSLGTCSIIRLKMDIYTIKSEN